MLYHHHLVRVPSLYALAHHPPGRTRTARSFRPITTSSGGDDSAVVASDSAVVASDCAVVASDCAVVASNPTVVASTNRVDAWSLTSTPTTTMAATMATARVVIGPFAAARATRRKGSGMNPPPAIQSPSTPPRRRSKPPKSPHAPPGRTHRGQFRERLGRLVAERRLGSERSLRVRVRVAGLHVAARARGGLRSLGRGDGVGVGVVVGVVGVGMVAARVAQGREYAVQLLRGGASGGFPSYAAAEPSGGARGVVVCVEVGGVGG